MPREIGVAALSLDPPVLQEARAVTLEAIERLMDAGVRAEQLGETRDELRRLLQASPLTGRALAVASVIGQGAMRANMLVDRSLTQLLRSEASESVEPVRVRILRGESIVRRGDRLTETHMRKLEALGLIGVMMLVAAEFVGLKPSAGRGEG